MGFKIIFFLRTFEGYSYLVSMLKEVFLDLRYFLTFFFFILATFAVSFWILKLNNEDYAGMHFMVGYLLMGFRISLGDTDID